MPGGVVRAPPRGIIIEPNTMYCDQPYSPTTAKCVMSAIAKRNPKIQNDSRVNIKAIRVKEKLKKLSYGSYYLDIMILRLISRLSLVEVK